MSTDIQVVIPGLFDLPLSEISPSFVADALPNLNQLLRFASIQKNQAFSVDSILQKSLNLNLASGACLPIAQAFAEPDEIGDHNMMIFEAVHLLPDLNNAVVIPIAKNEKNNTDINIIIKGLNDFFDMDFDIRSVADGLFFIRLHECLAPRHYPHILSVLGKPANPYIEQSRANLPWYKLLNEMQMFLHQHESNQQRLLQSLSPANSLWFWGAGEIEMNESIESEWFCDDFILNRFATSLGLETASIADIDSASASNNAVVVSLLALEALKINQQIELDQLLLDLEQQVFKPVLENCRQNNKTAVLRAGSETDFQMPPRSKFKFWRGGKTLLDWHGLRV